MLIGFSLTCLVLISLLNVFMGADINVATQQFEFAIGITESQGSFSIIAGMIVRISLIGIKIFDSGLSDETVSTLIILIVYTAIWGVFSILSWNLIMSIETFGVLIYSILTLTYVIGVIIKLRD